MKSVSWPVLGRILFCSAAAALPGHSFGQSGPPADDRFGLGIEFGPLWLSRNDVRIPGGDGTKFDMLDLTGSGPEFFARIDGLWNINDRHGLRIVLAPLELSGTGELAQDTDFAGTAFTAGATEGTYKFNTYRVTYRYTFEDRGAWRWRLGFTGIVRDANVELRQGSLSANDDNVGFVPTLHLSGDYRFADRWLFGFEFDGLAGGPGRLFDVAFKVDYDLNDNWRIGGGYRALEGGVDSDDVYNFALLHYAVLELRYRF